MDIRNENRESQCNIIVEGRKKISVSGVLDVDSFDEDNMILLTVMGTLLIKGNDFHINKLSVDTGELIIDGEFDSFVFDDSLSNKTKGNIWSKLFK